MNKEYYKEYFDLERNNWWFLARRNILKSQIDKVIQSSGKLKILNIGIATGASSEWLSGFGEVTSIEYDKEVCEFVRNELGLEVINGSITDLPFENNTFDLVCAFDVIEHVEDDEKAVLEMKRVCKEQGHLFITVPAFMHLWSEHDEINLHHRRYTLPGLSALTLKCGLENIKFKSYFNTFLYLPIYSMRFGSVLNKKKKEGQPKSDFSKIKIPFLEKIFYLIFNSENILLKKGKKLPFGVSIMIISQR